MYESFTSNKLQDNAESSDTLINKAVLTVASDTRKELFTINTIEFQSFNHLSSWKQIKKWVYLNILFSYVPLIVFFIYMFIYFWRFD